MANVSTIEGIRISADHWIGGARVPSSDMFLDVSPIDEQMLAMVARGGNKEADAAVAAAREACARWGGAEPGERARILHRIGEILEERADELAVIETIDNGSLFRFMRQSVMPSVAGDFHFFADRLVASLDEGVETRGEGRVRWEPAGVAVVAIPWNAPLATAAGRVAPALATGDTVVLKPHPWAPLTASLLADVTREAGLPDGVLNVLQGTGAESGAALVANPGVDRISFTGSAAAGRLVAAAAAANLTPVSLELGGTPPFLVFADADQEAAVAAVVGRFSHTGEVWPAGARLLAQREAHDGFLERLLERARALRQGDPRLAETDVGPLVTRERLGRVDGLVRDAIAAGARALLGGEPNQELGGWYYRPTVLADVPSEADILRRELRAPVLTLQPFDDEEEAIHLANEDGGCPAAAVFTGDRERARRVSARVRAGTVWVNCFGLRDPGAPSGGARGSGIGRPGDTRSFDFFADVKVVYSAGQDPGSDPRPTREPASD